MALLAGQNRVVTAVMSTGHRSFIYGTQREERIAIREKEVLEGVPHPRAPSRDSCACPSTTANYDVTEADIGQFSALLAELDPDWVFMPHRADAHPAHVASRRIALESLQRHLKASGGSVETWDYEGPWALFNRGDFNTIVSVPRIAFERKLAGHPAHGRRWRAPPTTWPPNPWPGCDRPWCRSRSLRATAASRPRLEPYLELFHRQGMRPEQALVPERA